MKNQLTKEQIAPEQQIENQKAEIQSLNRKIESLERELQRYIISPPDKGKFSYEYKPEAKHSEAELINQIKELQSKMDICNEKPDEDASEANDAAKLWWIVEKQLHLLPGHYEDYLEFANQMEEDLMMLGRIGHDVTFAHIQRTMSNVDFAAEHAGGEALTDEEFTNLFFVIDKLSSLFFTLKREYGNMHQSGKKTLLQLKIAAKKRQSTN